MLLPIAHGYLLNLLLPNKLSDHGDNSMRFICYVGEWGATCYLLNLFSLHPVSSYLQT